MTLHSKHSIRASATLLPLLLLLPTALAGTPSPPSAVVGQIQLVNVYQAPDRYEFHANLTWRLSPEDPDQTDGSFNYTIYANSTSGATGWINVSMCPEADDLLPNCSGLSGRYKPVPNRPGWVYYIWSQTMPQAGNVDLSAFNLTAWNATAQSIPSCLILFNDSRINNSHYQCGQPIVRAPRGLLAQIAQPMNRTIGASVQLRWNVSEDDPDQTNGSLNYRVFLTTNQYNLSKPGADLGLDVFGTGDASPPGIRYQLRNISNGDPFVAQFQVRVEDPLTHQWSNISCMVAVDLSQHQGADSCGVADIPEVEGDSPSFPWMDVEATASASGLDLSAFVWVLGGIMVLAGLLVGFLIAGSFGGIAAAGITTAWAATLFLFPWWFVVLIFLLATTVAVLGFSGGGQPA